MVFFQAPGLYLVLMLSIALLSGGAGGLLAWELLKLMEKYHITDKKEKRRNDDSTEKMEP